MRKTENYLTKRKLLAVMLFAVLLASAVGLFFSVLPSRAKAELKGASFEDEYIFNTELEIPQASIAVGGKELPAEGVVYYPSGLAYKKDTVKLDEMGEYTVEYAAKDGDRLYRETVGFSVYKPLFGVEGCVGASAEYKPSSIAPEVEGINVRLGAGSKFYYNRIIDLNSLSTNTPFVKAFISPEVRGELDGYTLLFRLTDVYDPDNYVTFKCNHTRAGIQQGTTYILCGGTDQALTGVERGWNRVHVNNIYGYPVACSFYGQAPSGELPQNDALTLYFDPVSMAAYADKTGNFIVDLDDPTYFTDPFLGFTTGEVYLSMWAEDFIKPTFGVEIMSVADHDLTDERLADEIGPEITVDMEGYEEMPVGLAGYDYPLFDAEATDNYSGSCEVYVNVYQNYHTNKKYDCYVENGVFKPDAAGTYTIEYKATDWVGNETVKTFDIEIKNSAEPVSVAAVGDPVGEGLVGTRIPVGEVAVSGGIGRTGVEIRVFDEREEEAELKDGAFIPRAAGKYIVEYTAYDFVGQKAVYSYEVDVTMSGSPVFEADAELPQLLFTHSEYTLPALSAFTYEGGKKEVATEITVKDGSGERKLDSSRKTVFSVKENMDEVLITYAAAGASVTYRIPCVMAFDEESNLQIQNYFATDNMTVDVGSSFTAFTAEKNENASLRFLNPLLDNDLEVEFIVDPAKNSYGAIAFKLTDLAGNSVSARIVKTASGSEFHVGGKSITLSKNFTESPKNEFSFCYDADERKLSADGINFLPVLTDDGGREFTGFAGHKVYVEMTLLNVSGASAVQMLSVNNQLISNKEVLDRVAPGIYLEGVYGGSAKVGDTISLNDVYVGDVIDPNPTVELRVTGPDGVVKDLNGVSIAGVVPESGMAFKIENYGTYSVTYTAADVSGAPQTFKYNISVIDDVAPVIEALGEMKSECKLNQKVVVPEISATDNVTAPENLSIWRYVELPTGRIVELPEGADSFYASYAGDYRVLYVVYDEAGNQAILELNLVCKQ